MGFVFAEKYANEEFNDLIKVLTEEGLIDIPEFQNFGRFSVDDLFVLGPPVKLAYWTDRIRLHNLSPLYVKLMTAAWLRAGKPERNIMYREKFAWATHGYNNYTSAKDYTIPVPENETPEEQAERFAEEVQRLIAIGDFDEEAGDALAKTILKPPH